MIKDKTDYLKECMSMFVESEVGIKRKPPMFRGLKSYYSGKKPVPPKQWIDYHVDLAKESLGNLKRDFGVTTLKTWMEKSKVPGGHNVLFANVKTKNGTEKTIHWSSSLTGGSWMIKLKGGMWGSAFSSDFIGEKDR